MGDGQSADLFEQKLSRRDVIIRAGVGLGSLSVAGPVLAACGAGGGTGNATAGTITIGFVSPRTGPAAGFGEPDGYVLSLARKAFANGLSIGGKQYSVTIVDKDSQSDPARSATVAHDLINSSNVDLMLTTSTPETVNPVSDASEAAGVPCVSTVVPWEAWYFGRGAKAGQPSPFKYTYHFCFGVQQFDNAYTHLWPQVPTNMKVGVMWPNDADGNAIRAALGPLLTTAGYTIVDPGAYTDGTNDYSSQIAKTGLFPSQVQSLGAIGVNLAGGAYWTPTFPYKSPLTGVTSKQLGDGYQSTIGKQWNQQLGPSLALFDVAAAVLTASGNPKDKKAVAKAMGSLSVDTPVGHLDWSKGPVANVVATPILGGQWVAGSGAYPLDFVLCENSSDANVPVAAKLTAYS